MKVYHETFGTGKVLSSTETLDESGSIVSADVMFEHGIEVELPIFEVTYSAKKAAAGEDIGKPGKEFKKIAAKAASKYGSKAAGGRVAGAILKKLRSEEVEQVDEATKGEAKVNASIQKMMKKTQKEKVGTDETRSNLQWPLHKIKSDSHDEDDDRVKELHLIRAKDKHAAVAKVQLALSKAGHSINSVKHAGMVKEEVEDLDEGGIETPKKNQLYQYTTPKTNWTDYVKDPEKRAAAKALEDKEREGAKLRAKANRAAKLQAKANRKPKVQEEVEDLDEKLIGKQHKIDANKNGKIDAEDFKKLRKEDSDCSDDDKKSKKSKKDYEDVSSDNTDKDMSESTVVKMTPDSAAIRMPVVENTIRSILSQSRNLRQEAKIAEFKSRK